MPNHCQGLKGTHNANHAASPPGIHWGRRRLVRANPRIAPVTGSGPHGPLGVPGRSQVFDQQGQQRESITKFLAGTAK